MMTLVWRFIVGGLAVSAFAVLGDLLRPKSFAGLFGAAPSVALATLSLTVADKGAQYAATEARSMMLGAVAFLLYACVASRLMFRHLLPATKVTLTALSLWLAVAIIGWAALLRS
jgi:hypothetical protein